MALRDLAAALKLAPRSGPLPARRAVGVARVLLVAGEPG
jgi:hypothetical protein